MPFPIQHTYVSVIGDAYAGTERWQFGFRLTPQVVGNEAAALALSVHLEDWWRPRAPYGLGTTFNASASHRLTELKVATIQPDGTYPDDQPSYSHFFLPPINGSNQIPAGTTAQDTVAVTLTTALPRGLASKGRMFLPPSSLYLPAQADGLLTAAAASNIRDSIKLLINQINADPLIGNVAVFSRGKGVPQFDAARNKIIYTYPNPGAVNNVTGVSVGRVIDTQRRRRRQLGELPQAAAL